MSNSFKFHQALERKRAEALLAEIEADLRSAEFDLARMRTGSDGDPMLDSERVNRKQRRADERIRSGKDLIYKTTFNR